MENQPTPQDNRPEWLRQMAGDSWNMELVISGAAVFLASYLPGLVDDALRFYLENFVQDENLKKIAFPLLAYSFIKIAAWLLLFTFVLHFVLRAFWVGVVGLHTVYTPGIQYDKLPWMNDFSRSQMRAQFGALSDYILRLDKICNQVFSIAFLIALYSLGIGMIYMVIFFALNVIPVLVADKALAKTLSTSFMLLIASIAFLPLTLQMLLRNPRLAEKEWLKKSASWATRRVGLIIMPFVARPINYLNMTFSSNMPVRRMLIVSSVGGVIVSALVLDNTANVVFALSGRTAFHTRNFFARGQNEFGMQSAPYDKLRSENDRLPPVSIPAEIVEEKFLRVFVLYPKSLDAALMHFCHTPVLPDSLPRNEKNRQIDSLHLVCLQQFLRLTVNDSLLREPQWLFHEHPKTGSPGLVAYLPAEMFKPGKNELLVQVPSSQKPDSLRVYGRVPFWYAPKD